MHCTSAECLDLCGEACARGDGAVCALTVFQPRNLQAACQKYGYCEPGFYTDDVQPVDYIPPADKTVAGVTGGGCDNHAWCLFCAPYETCSSIITAASSAMILLGKLATQCRRIGCNLEPPDEAQLEPEQSRSGHHSALSKLPRLHHE